jgi:choline dehydrogenase-like flavoprotein
MCLYGCPRQVIYSAAHSLAELRGRPGFTYVGGTVVEAFAESRSQVEIRCRSHSGGERITFAAERLFLAGGTLGTARIALASFKTRRPLLIKDSQYFLLPMLRFEGVPGVARESLHTMAQVFLEMADCLPGARSVHLQAYTYNDLYSSMLAQRFGALARLARAPVEALLGRLIVMQGYLHSDDSSAIDVRLEGSGHEVRLVLSPRVNARAKMVARAAMRKLFKHRKHLRTIPLSPLATIGKPGEGSHVGGTFPMRRAPGELETDIFGRLKGFERVHIVDASVFPSIPATTITLSVMANAHRIGSSVPHDGPPGD